MMLWLTPEQARDVLEHARTAAPNEACGLLIGKAGQVAEVVRTRNEDLNPRTGFVVSPRDLFVVLNRVEQQSLELVGVYHSHPTGHPIPSERDIREAHYPEAAQLIVGMVKPEPEFAAWRIDAGRVSRVDLFIQAVRPFSTEVEPEKLTFSQRVAVVIAGIIAVAIVLITAISLLPPPELPT